ncbi:MAG: type 1 glutamine amidotransferase domain-containing protein [Cyclobacteriaceae bacterium]
MRNSIHTILLLLLIGACSSPAPDRRQVAPDIIESSAGKILFIVSNADHYGSSDLEAANHFHEIILAYDVLAQAGYTMDFVSPKGGAVPIGYIYTSDSLTRKYLYDEDFMNDLEHTLSAAEVNPSDYEAVYYGGGGSAMFGVPENETIQQISREVWEQGGIVSALCHGTAGLAHLRLSDGNYLVSDKKVVGFPDLFEDMEAQYYQQFPFSIEQIINERGGNFLYSEEGWDGYVEQDGRLITGQDPTSAALIAERIIQTLQNQ